MIFTIDLFNNYNNYINYSKLINYDYKIKIKLINFS